MIIVGEKYAINNYKMCKHHYVLYFVMIDSICPQQNQPQFIATPPQQQQYDPNNPGPQQWSNEQSGGNWKGNGPPPNMQGGQTWTNQPKTKVTQKGNMTITETTQSGGGKGRTTEYHGPPQLGPGKVQSSGPYKPTTEEEKRDYFRLKLWEMNCCCGCGNTDHPCLNLWLWAIWWLIIFMVNGVINFIGNVAQMSSGGAYSAIAIIIIIVSICINVWAFIALFKLQPIAFLVQLVMFALLLLMVVIGLFVYSWNWGFFIMNVIFIVCDVWAAIVFWRVWGWAKHFKNGGKYDPDMTSPP